LHAPIGLGVARNRAEGADDVDTEMVKKTRVFSRQSGLNHVRWNFIKRNGVVLANAALADNFAIHIGKGDGIFTATVPHIAGSRKRRQSIGQQTKGKQGAERCAIIQQINEPAARARHPKITVQKRAIGRTGSAHALPAFEQ